MSIKEIQLNLWETDLEKVKELNEQDRMLKMRKQVRAAFHILDKVSKKIEEKAS